MKHLSKIHKMSALLGASLLMVTACAPDSRPQSGSAQPAPIERNNDNGAAANANEAGAPAASDVNSSTQSAAASAINSSAQPAAASAVNPAFASPLPTPIPQPTAKPRGEIEFTGLVEAIASDMWVVGGRTLAVTAATEIKPGLVIGTQAKVHAVPQADGSLWAREIELAGDDDDDNGNSNGNDNGNSNDNDNGNGNSNDDNGNGNSNDDNGNDDDGNGNSNDDNGNDDDDGNGNSNDDNGNDDDGNGNSNDDNGNDDHGGNDNGNGNHG